MQWMRGLDGGCGVLNLFTSLELSESQGTIRNYAVFVVVVVFVVFVVVFVVFVVFV